MKNSQQPPFFAVNLSGQRTFCDALFRVAGTALGDRITLAQSCGELIRRDLADRHDVELGAETQGAPWKLNPKTPWKNPDALINRLPIEEMLESYKNHEIAVHSYTHPHLENLSREECTKEIAQDIARLTEVFGYTPMGMAYPYGSYSDMVVEVLREQGIRYARTTRTTHSFAPQRDLLRFHPTCHHKDAQLMAFAKRFIEAEPEEPMLFYVWGHSYEFAGDDNWDIIERFCAYMADRDDVFYGTNTEVLL